MEFVNNLIANAVNDLHIAYLARVLRINGNRATVQPLSRYKEQGQEAKDQAVVNALILNNAKYKLKTELCPYSFEVVTAQPIQSGDVVLCVVCDRDISGQTSGQITTPNEALNFSLSNSVIVGIL